MKLKEYRGRFLELKYPGFLKVKAEGSEWYAAANGRAGVLITINPPTVIAESFSNSIRHPAPTVVPYEREGTIQTPNGIAGHELLIDHGETMVWNIDGKSKHGQIVQIQVWTVQNDWHDGTIWEDLVNSIEIIGNLNSQELVRKPEKIKSRRKTVLKKRKIKLTGALRELPSDLHYLLDFASEMDSFTGEHLEENPEVAQVLEAWFKKESGHLTKQKSQADGERLLSWLQQFPVEKHPETGSLYGVAGILISFGFNP